MSCPCTPTRVNLRDLCIHLNIPTIIKGVGILFNNLGLSVKRPKYLIGSSPHENG